MTNRKRVKRRGRTVIVADDWPYWAGGTRRAWRQQKRRELIAVEKALEALRFGCAFFPSSVRDSYDESRGVGVIVARVREMRRLMSAKVWR